MQQLKLHLMLLAIVCTVCFTACDDDDNEPAGANLTELYVSSNTASALAVVDFSDAANPMTKTLSVAATDADGVAYDAGSNVLYQNNRTANRIDAYSMINNVMDGAKLTPAFSSSSDFTNAREIFQSGNRIVVAQDADASNGQMNKFYVYQINGNALSLMNTYTVSINLWGIHIEGNTLYAIVDNSDKLAVFNNFFSNPDGMIMPNITVQVEGIVRTHGITYSASDDIMVLTDVGEASSADDGAVHVISSFMSKLSGAGNNGIISLGSQIRVAGSSTLLGNPVDVAYDSDTKMIYIAERAKDGGRILGFDYPTTNGNFAPVYNQLFSGASAVFLNKGRK